ncbi:hypothetical protein HRbin26_01535 [bacterium HR26]|nr:hypothetical protein HRbin26_01535 [bacterium HR26]
MRFLANENVPAAVVDRLRELGHDVAWIRVENPGWPDRKILQRAVTEDRILITFDKDFGALAFHAGLPASSGIILLRLNASSPEELATRVAAALESSITWAGCFAVVEDDRIRVRPLPGPRA